MTRFTVDDLHYNVLTHGDGAPLVLLHGFTGSAANWEPIIEPLTLQHCVIAIDIIGHGESDKPLQVERYTMPNAARELAKLIQSLTSDPVHLLGYSMGGRLALYMAIHYPNLLRSLVLESASPGLATQRERDERTRHDNALADRIEKDGIQAFVDFWESLPLWDSQLSLSPEIRQQLRQQRLRNTPHGLANSLRGMGTGVQSSLWGKLERLAMPVLLITGELDDKFCQINHEMKRKIPGSRMAVIPQAGHTVHLEQPDIYVKMVQDFIPIR